MNRILLLALLFAPSLAAAQVKGIKLVYQDATPQTRPQPTAGRLAIGKDWVSLVIEDNPRPSLFHFDGKPAVSISLPSTNTAVFAGENLYVATGAFGFNVVETKNWQTIQNLSGPKMNNIGGLEATPDGKYVFTLHGFPLPTVTVYDRDAKSGKLVKSQIFQADEASIAEARRSFAELPPGSAPDMTVDKNAVRVPNFSHANTMRASADGRFLFVTNYAMAVVVFGRDEHGQWNVVDSLADNVAGFHKWGLQFCTAVMPVGKHVFVGGIRRLAMLDFDGKKLISQGTFWVDDSEPAGHSYETVPYLDHVLSIAASQNEKFLFVAAKDDGGVTVLKIGKDDLELVGKVDDSPGGKAFEVHSAGNKLFVKTTTSPLLIYDLDATFTK